MGRNMIIRLAGLGLIAAAVLADLPGYWPFVLGIGGAVLFLLAGPS